MKLLTKENKMEIEQFIISELKKKIETLIESRAKQIIGNKTFKERVEKILSKKGKIGMSTREITLVLKNINMDYSEKHRIAREYLANK